MAVFLHSGDYDRVHQGLSIAAAAAAAGRPVEVFWFWWALQRWARGDLDEPDFGPAAQGVADSFERRGAPTLRQLLAHLTEAGGCTFYACTGSMGALDLQAEGMPAGLDRLVGWSAILQLTAGVTDRFYL